MPDNESFIQSDGGQILSHYEQSLEPCWRGEENTCTVRALATAAGITYDCAHTALSRAGRNEGEGIKFTDFPDALKKSVPWFTVLPVPIKMPDNARIKIKDFTVYFPSGRFLIATDQHVHAVVNGIHYDFSEPDLEETILSAWWLRG